MMFHVRVQKILSEGVQFNSDIFIIIFLDEGREDPNATKSRPSSARQWNTIKGVR